MRHFALLLIIAVMLGGVSCSRVQHPQRTPEQEALIEQELRGLLYKTVLLLRKGDSESLVQAESMLLLAQELRFNDARILDGLGCLAWRRGDMDLASRYFRDSIAKDPNYDRPYVHLASIAESRGDVSTAKELLVMALKINPMNYRARNNLMALLVDKEGDVPQAYRELLKVKEGVGEIDPIFEHNNQYLHGRLQAFANKKSSH